MYVVMTLYRSQKTTPLRDELNTAVYIANFGYPSSLSLGYGRQYKLIQLPYVGK